MPSRRLFRAGELPATTKQIATVLGQKSYPCIAALRSFHRNDYVTGVYGGFGSGRNWADLREDLVWFLEEQRRTGSPYSTMWAIYPNTPAQDEEDFEDSMWSELSHLTSAETRESDWRGATSDPSSRDFSFRIDGSALFVVGLHPRSSRAARRFPWTAMIFNAFDQFERIEAEGTYERMVALNRARDEAFQGDANPMCLAHGDAWETIQFSGRANTPDWQCPFRFMSESEKH